MGAPEYSKAKPIAEAVSTPAGTRRSATRSGQRAWLSASTASSASPVSPTATIERRQVWLVWPVTDPRHAESSAGSARSTAMSTSMRPAGSSPVGAPNRSASRAATQSR